MRRITEDHTKRTSDMVYEIIESKILSGEWGPGTKIMSEQQLSKELGVSRMSVREAIEKMAALNILNKRQGEGTFVNNLDPSIYLNNLIPMITLDKDSYLDILEFRLIIEVESAKLCAKRYTQEIMEEIERHYELMLKNKDDYEKFAEGDLNFHYSIAKGSGNSLVIKVNDVLRSLMEHHQMSLYDKLGPYNANKEHKLIMEAIKNRDGELSSIYMKRHIKRVIREIKSLI